MTVQLMPKEYTPKLKDGEWVKMACRNHPNLRWVRKNPEHLKRCISNNPNLMFRGSVDSDKIYEFAPGLQSRAFRLREDESWEGGHLQDRVDWVMRMIEKGYVFECPCSISDLYYIKDGNV